jgi:hypothetical protein
VIIYELLANGIQHPRAETLTVASYMGSPSIQPWSADPALTIALWDDGVSSKKR